MAPYPHSGTTHFSALSSWNSLSASIRYRLIKKYIFTWQMSDKVLANAWESLPATATAQARRYSPSFLFCSGTEEWKWKQTLFAAGLFRAPSFVPRSQAEISKHDQRKIILIILKSPEIFLFLIVWHYPRINIASVGGMSPLLLRPLTWCPVSCKGENRFHEVEYLCIVWKLSLCGNGFSADKWPRMLQCQE